MKPLRVIVTGAGSIVGQGIVKALRMSSLPVHVIATDIGPLNAALFRADEGHLMVPVESSDALERIIAQLKQLKADALMIGSEFDLAFFALHKQDIERETGTLIVVSSPETVDLADDKFLTAEFLRNNGLAYAPAANVGSIDQACDWATQRGYPLILKTRRGTSSRHVHIIADETALREIFPSVPLPMVQELAGPVHPNLANEYTCSIFRCADGTLQGPFVSRRTLRGGSSWLVEVAPRPEANDLMLRLGHLLPIMGSLNVQMMIHGGRAIPFELNARFSGTTPIRAHFGFNEPEMTLRSYLLGETVPESEIGCGTVIRYVEEIFLDGFEAKNLTEPFPRGTIRTWF